MKSKVLFVFSVLGILLSVTLLDSCKEKETDPCDNVTCLNGGYCANGDCVCPQGYGGSDCSQQIIPSKIRISKIEVTKFPATDNDGAGWDVASGPDIQPEILLAGNTIWKSNEYYQNADPSQNYSFELNPVVDLTNPQSQYSIRLYDYDDFSVSDFMGGINFVPYSNTNGFPTVIDLDAGGAVTFKLYVTYVWD